MLSSVCFRAFADLRMSEKKYALNISAHLVELNKQPNQICDVFSMHSGVASMQESEWTDALNKRFAWDPTICLSCS